MAADLLEDPQAGERLLASACRFLADGGDDEVARLLATCSARVRPIVEPSIFGRGTTDVLEVFLTAPRRAYDALTSGDGDEWGDEPGDVIRRALRAFIPNHMQSRITVLAELIEPEEDWRATYGASRPKEPPLPPPPALPPGGEDDIPF